MIQYMRLKETKVMGKRILLYLSMSEAAIPSRLSRCMCDLRVSVDANGAAALKYSIIRHKNTDYFSGGHNIFRTPRAGNLPYNDLMAPPGKILYLRRSMVQSYWSTFGCCLAQPMFSRAYNSALQSLELVFAFLELGKAFEFTLKVSDCIKLYNGNVFFFFIKMV